MELLALIIWIEESSINVVQIALFLGNHWTIDKKIDLYWHQQRIEMEWMLFGLQMWNYIQEQFTRNQIKWNHSIENTNIWIIDELLKLKTIWNEMKMVWNGSQPTGLENNNWCGIILKNSSIRDQEKISGMKFSLIENHWKHQTQLNSNY